MDKDLRTFLGLGSNVEDRYKNLKKGIREPEFPSPSSAAALRAPGVPRAAASLTGPRTLPIDSRINPTASGELVASPGRPCEAGGGTKRFQFCPAQKWTQKSKKGRANLLNSPGWSKLESSASNIDFHHAKTSI